METAVGVETSLAQAIIKVDAERKELNDKLDALVKQRAELQRDLLALWEQSGTSQVRIDGRLVHLRRDVYAGIADRSALVAWLEGNGFADLVTVNSTTLSSWVREQYAGAPGELPALPDELQPLINVSETFTIRTRS